jgi:hypothetical protein
MSLENINSGADFSKYIRFFLETIGDTVPRNPYTNIPLYVSFRGKELELEFFQTIYDYPYGGIDNAIFEEVVFEGLKDLGNKSVYIRVKSMGPSRCKTLVVTK